MALYYPAIVERGDPNYGAARSGSSVPNVMVEAARDWLHRDHAAAA